MNYKWKIWYDDGTSHTGTTEDEWNVFVRDGILIVKEYGGCNIIHMGMDYYWFENGSIKSCNPKDLHGYLRRPEGLKNMKFGRWTDNKVWEKVHKEAMNI